MEGLEEEESSNVKLRVVMLPWLAHGHILPFLELAKRLSHENILVHICSTPINIDSIKEELLNDDDDKAFPLVKFTQLHLPAAEEELPPHLHTTKHLPSHLMPQLKTAFDRADPSFRDTLLRLRPDLLIYDFLQPWAPRAAHDHNIPALLFLTTSATSVAYFTHFLKRPRDVDEFPFACPGQTRARMASLEGVANGITNGDRFLECMDLSSDFVAIKTFGEIESGRIEYLSSLIGKEMVPVGPLIPNTTTTTDDDSRKLIWDWLSKKETSSVVFASFGSEYFMSEEEMEEIAAGLEMSKLSFIWVVRFPKGGSGKEEEEEEEREKRWTTQRISDEEVGLVVTGWAPQREILGHPSTGGFLTHCGWSSVMEGMRFGVPMIAVPMQLDQPINAKLVAELGVGVEVERNYVRDDSMRSASYRGEDVARGIRDVVVNEEGRGVRRKASEMAEMMGYKGNEEIENLVAKMGLLVKKRGQEERK